MLNARVRSVLMASAAALVVTACGADDVASPGEGVIIVPAPTPAPAPTPTPTPTPTPPATGPAADCPNGTANVGTITTGGNATLRNCQVSGVITGNLVLPRRVGTIYSLSGRVSVGIDVGADGSATGGQAGILTIEPGVTLFGSSGADFLLVNRGSQIFAEGTAAQPIVMTARNNVLGTATATNKGLWGGVVVLGRAPISNCATGGVDNPGGTRADCSQQVEGTSGASYGGALPNDNSGRMSFLQVRYAGFEVAPGNELNGITLGGVGRSTFFENIQIHNGSDDGIEWFGGTVNGRNLALTGIDDDSIDTDFGFQADLQFVLVVQDASANHGWENDSNGSEDARPRQRVRISNATFVSTQTSLAESVFLLRGGTDVQVYNSVLNGAGSCVDIDSPTTINPANSALDEQGPPVFRSVFMSCPTPFSEVTANGGGTPVTAAQIEAIFNPTGVTTNNVARGTSTLSAIFINGANETGVPVFNLSTLPSSSYFVSVPYIGAVRDAADTRFQGWTCGLYTANPSCLSITPVTA